jgi:hypothetical protein
MRGRECLAGSETGKRRQTCQVGLDEKKGINYSPVEGRSPNWTICLNETPVAGKLA